MCSTTRNKKQITNQKITVDGDHFNPHGFGVGLAATVGVGFAAAALQVGNNVAEVVAEHREADAWDSINETVQHLLDENLRLRAQITEWAVAIETIGVQFKVMTDLAVSQGTQLQALREAGVID
jgi:hypothetical protein